MRRVSLMVGLVMLAVGLALAAMSDAPERTGAIDELSDDVDDAPAHPVARAVHRSRQARNARTLSVAPDGVTPSRTTGVVDFRTRRSDVVVEILRDDGSATPYGRVVRTPQQVYVGKYLGRAEPRWRRIDPDTLAADDAVGFVMDGLTVLDALDEQHRMLSGTPTSARGYRRHAPAPTGPDNAVGLVILAFRLDADARVGEVHFTIPALREHVFTITFSGYGEAPPVEEPAVD